MVPQIENLVFEGGGVKGIAYAGALQVLEQNKSLSTLTGVAGTSAGAITACLVGLGYSASQIEQIIRDTPMTSFEDHENIFRKYEYYGMHPGDTFLAWLKQQIAAAAVGLNAEASFADFHAATGKDLRVFATDLYLQTVREFSFRATPAVVVAEAVRASMSIPLFFDAYTFSNNNPDDHLYVDGGTVYNYPLGTFDPPNEVNPNTLGFRLEDINGVRPPDKFGYGHWVQYVKNLFATLMAAQSIDVHNDPEQMARSVIINDLGIPTTDFKITSAQEDALVQSGVAATQAYLAKVGMETTVFIEVNSK